MFDLLVLRRREAHEFIGCVHVPVAANRQAAVAVYTAPPIGGEFRGAAIHVVAMRDGRITQMTRFAAPHLFPRFGLPTQLPDVRSWALE